MKPSAVPRVSTRARTSGVSSQRWHASRSKPSTVMRSSTHCTSSRSTERASGLLTESHTEGGALREAGILPSSRDSRPWCSPSRSGGRGGGASVATHSFSPDGHVAWKGAPSAEPSTRYTAPCSGSWCSASAHVSACRNTACPRASSHCPVSVRPEPVEACHHRGQVAGSRTCAGMPGGRDSRRRSTGRAGTSRSRTRAPPLWRGGCSCESRSSASSRVISRMSASAWRAPGRCSSHSRASPASNLPR